MRIFRCGKSVYPVPETAGESPQYEIHDPGLQRDRKQLCQGGGLACKRKFHGNVFGRGLILSNSGAVTANYWLSEIYDPEIADAHRNADIHIHDLSMLTGYCAGWSLKQLIMEGLGGIKGKITSSPAKHLSVLCNQMVNFLGIMQNEWAGAQAFSSFDTYLAPFAKVDNLSYPEVKKCIESFIYGVNTPSRWGLRRRFPILHWTGRYRRILQNFLRLSAAKRWISVIKTVSRRWI